MDVRQNSDFYLAFLVSLTLSVAGFCPRHLNRWAAFDGLQAVITITKITFVVFF
jgi:hypothetical protein